MVELIAIFILYAYGMFDLQVRVAAGSEYPTMELHFDCQTESARYGRQIERQIQFHRCDERGRAPGVRKVSDQYATWCALPARRCWPIPVEIRTCLAEGNDSLLQS